MSRKSIPLNRPFRQLRHNYVRFFLIYIIPYLYGASGPSVVRLHVVVTYLAERSIRLVYKMEDISMDCQSSSNN